MAVKSKGLRIGELAFFAGVLLAIVAGLFPEFLAAGTVAVTLVILGLIVGFLNIGKGETTNFLIAAIALLVAGAAGLGALPYVGSFLAQIVINIVTFVAPAAIIVALKGVWDLAKKK